MTETSHPDLYPPDKTPDESTVMTYGDSEYQRRIEAIQPDESFLSPARISELATAIGVGHTARDRLASDDFDDANKEELEHLASEGLGARNMLVAGHLRFVTWEARASTGLDQGESKPVSGRGIKKTCGTRRWSY